MSDGIVVLVTLILYKIVLVTIGVVAGGRNHDQTDYFLGGRGLGPWVASLSASASSSSAWTLLGVSGAAYTWGIASLWLFPACLSGFLINWVLVAPRLRALGAESGALTVTEILGGRQVKAIGVLASAILLFSLLFYVASQFQGSAKTFQSTFGLGETESILIGGGIIMFYTMLGGFWAVSITDSLQGLVMAVTALVLPLGAFIAVGGPGELIDGIQAVGAVDPSFTSWIRGMEVPAGVAFVLGLLGIGLGYPGQPHVVNRFMALKSDKAVRQGRAIAIGWAVLVYAGMILLGICGRVLFESLPDAEMVFLEVANQYFHPIVAGVMVAGVLSATMSTADSQLLVAASAITHDLPFGLGEKRTLFFSRIVVIGLSLGAMLVALYGSSEIFSKVLFAWSAIGAAFGPLLLVRLFAGPVRPSMAFAAMITGFALSVIAYSIPEAKGTYWERIVPFVVAFGIAAAGRQTSSK